MKAPYKYQDSCISLLDINYTTGEKICLIYLEYATALFDRETVKMIGLDIS